MVRPMLASALIPDELDPEHWPTLMNKCHRDTVICTSCYNQFIRQTQLIHDQANDSESLEMDFGSSGKQFWLRRVESWMCVHATGSPARMILLPMPQPSPGAPGRLRASERTPPTHESARMRSRLVEAYKGRAK